MNKPKLIKSSASVATVAILFVVVITIWAELSVPLKNWLASFSGHHWTSKSILSILIYAVMTIVIYFASNNPNNKSVCKSLSVLFATTILGTIAIAFFYTSHHLKIF